MASKLLTKLGAIRDPKIARNPNLPLNATRRLFSHRPISTPPHSPPSSPPDNGKSAHKKSKPTSSLKDLELAKFSAIADSWWDSVGPFKPLHAMNPTRLAFLRSTLCRHFRKDPHVARPFEGLKIVDVGCGGGILSEPLARMGATVTGIDALEKNINIARLHAGLDPVTSTIEYCCTTAGGCWHPLVNESQLSIHVVQCSSFVPQKLVKEQKMFDAVIALEVIEHVADPTEFCKSLSALTHPGGATVISTINRSMRSYATAIVAAEYLLHWLPIGTHQWSSFLTPEELVLILQRASINVKEMAGFVYNPLTGRWSLSDDISVNFIAFGTKNGQ
ncbi:ubiquinone biosynthesis O-methyltransferase, mitochondrial isoform X1 [Hevea brasiliensis]|uniref:ubiquinone biosynthesis O-methyltransferase, mitochondrial isoform X1 n=1 Tax=Hevea brasiliensis TaxID=3981 RepID=UPI0025D3BF4A|nr:ubiquinone biosynthesis O-methyltransferase, mitochondrial isoform X1 [Hevea brasiliensis]